MEDRVSSGWPAPAKINLFLHITGRRADGYHTLQTAFQFLDLCDELDFTLRTDGRITRSAGPSNVAPEQDLAVRAAQQLKQHTGCHLGVDIRVQKRIPMGGGLGGGSSDAACVLVALNALWRLALDTQTLAELGLELGADVPVFVSGHAAWAEGVGEELVPLEPLQRWYLLIQPRCEVSTAAVFADAELTRNTPPITMHAFLESGGQNDCERVVRRLYPEVGDALDWLASMGDARMTGTGGCVFCGFQTREQAQQAATQAPMQWRSYIVQGRNRSPLLERLQHKL